jgi:glutathione reductase (NADPH)
VTDFDYDLLVLGGGSGGVRGARMAAALGARTVLIEAAAMGGTCVNLGCIPKKLFAYAGHFHDDFEDARGFGWQLPGKPQFDWKTLRAAKDKEIARLNRIYEDVLDRVDVEVVRGWGQVTGPHTVKVGEREISAKHLLIATGGKSTRPVFPGVELGDVSDDLFSWEELPSHVAILGGGYIGVEFASILAGMGAQVHLIIRDKLPLREFDHDLRHELANELRKKGVHTHFSCNIERIERGGERGLLVHLVSGESLEVAKVLLATGRGPNTAGLGLETAGVTLSERGAVLVDDHFKTTAPSIYAVGDVIARMALTPVALGEAMVVVDQLFGKGERPFDYANIPTAVFTSPPIATVGLTETFARTKMAVRIYKSRFKPLKHTLSGRDERTLVKLVVEASTDRVVGLHMIGPDAPEIVQGFAVALQCGATKAQFDRTIGIHPTAAEEFVTLRTEWVPEPDPIPVP